MAQPEFMMSPGVTVSGRKPKTTIYTVLLIIALLAMLIGCLMMWLEIKQLEGTFGGVRGKVSVNALASHLIVAVGSSSQTSAA
jgi:hypothetical protein